MRTFKDSFNRDWTFYLSTWEAMRIKSDVGIDILEWGEEDLFTKLGKNPLVFADIAWILAEKQARTLGVDKQGFCEGIDGDKFTELSDLILEEIIEYFPAQKKTLLTKIVTRAKAEQQKALLTMTTLVESGS